MHRVLLLSTTSRTPIQYLHPPPTHQMTEQTLRKRMVIKWPNKNSNHVTLCNWTNWHWGIGDGWIVRILVRIERTNAISKFNRFVCERYLFICRRLSSTNGEIQIKKRAHRRFRYEWGHCAKATKRHIPSQMTTHKKSLRRNDCVMIWRCARYLFTFHCCMVFSTVWINVLFTLWFHNLMRFI